MAVQIGSSRKRSISLFSIRSKVGSHLIDIPSTGLPTLVRERLARPSSEFSDRNGPRRQRLRPPLACMCVAIALDSGFVLLATSQAVLRFR
jgi:hypothetical protein